MTARVAEIGGAHELDRRGATPLWVQLLKIPLPWLYAGILVFATMGTIAANPSVIELLLLSGFGVLGFLMRRYDYPVAPVVVGLG